MNRLAEPISPPLTDSARPLSGLLTKKELASELRCSERQIERLQRAGKIGFVKFSQRMIRYRRESVLRALVRLETGGVE